MAHPSVACADVERAVDLGTQFCERCGRDRDSFASARNTYRDCPSCGAACCADCWNLVDLACLACAPFRLTDATTRPRIVIAADLAAEKARVDPYSDLRSDPGTPPDLNAWVAARGPARQWPRDVAATGLAASSTPRDPSPLGDAGPSVASPSGPRRRAGRVGLAASAAWVVVGALAVVALGASPALEVPVPIEAPPAASSSPPSPSQPASPAPPARPTPAPIATAAPQSGGSGTHGMPRTTPRPTRRPTGPVVVAPPPPIPTPVTTPEPLPTATTEATPGETLDP